MSLAKEILETIIEFAKNKKPSQDPSCNDKFSRICWKINEKETKILGDFSWRKHETWTELFGTRCNYKEWIHNLIEHLNGKYPGVRFEHDFNITARTRIEIISWKVKGEVSLGKEILETITNYSKRKKPSSDPRCIKKFNSIKWSLNTEETKVMGKFSWKKDGAWTEPFGTIGGYRHWFINLFKYLDKRYPLEFKHCATNDSKSRTEIISWRTKEEVIRETKEEVENIRSKIIEFMKNNPVEIDEPFVKFAKGHKFLTIEWENFWDDPDSDCEKEFDRDHMWEQRYLNGYYGDTWGEPDSDLRDKYPEECDQWYNRCGPFNSCDNYKKWYEDLINLLNKLYPEFLFSFSYWEGDFARIYWKDKTEIDHYSREFWDGDISDGEI